MLTRVLLAALALVACEPAAQNVAPPHGVEVIFLDVGQGDAIVIRSPEGKVALIDAGRSGEVVGTLYGLGIDSIDIAIASHPHADHIGGMSDVIRSIPVRFYLDNGVPHTTATYRGLLRTLQSSSITYLEAKERRIQLGSAELSVLPPPPGGGASLNDGSVGVLLQFGEFKALFTGDSEIGELNHFLSVGVPEVTLLKAAHHGSRDAVSPAWLSATQPKVVVISCGANNPYGHPDPWALRYYDAVASEVYRTDVHGRITITASSDGSYTVSTGRRTVSSRQEIGGHTRTTMVRSEGVAMRREE